MLPLLLPLFRHAIIGEPVRESVALDKNAFRTKPLRNWLLTKRTKNVIMKLLLKKKRLIGILIENDRSSYILVLFVLFLSKKSILIKQMRGMYVLDFNIVFCFVSGMAVAAGDLTFKVNLTLSPT